MFNSRSDFEALANAYAADLYRFAYWKCHDRTVAEDLVQETFTRAWASWRSLRDVRSVKSWLFTILHREHARLYQRKREELPESELEHHLLRVESTLQQGAELREALWLLPESFRDALLLQVLAGLSCAEIGEMLNVSEAAVMQRVSRARRALRKLLEPEQERKERRS